MLCHLFYSIPRAEDWGERAWNRIESQTEWMFVSLRYFQFCQRACFGVYIICFVVIFSFIWYSTRSCWNSLWMYHYLIYFLVKQTFFFAFSIQGWFKRHISSIGKIRKYILQAGVRDIGSPRKIDPRTYYSLIFAFRERGASNQWRLITIGVDLSAHNVGIGTTAIPL